MLENRHIQDFSNASSLEPHWGYADRVVPCTNDAGSCAYLDVVYTAHDVGMYYTGILWMVIIGGLLLWAILYRLQLRNALSMTLLSLSNRYLGTDIRLPRWLSVFSRKTRLQVAILTGVTIYLTIFTFAGITYNTWVTPVKNTTSYNTRTSLGPWSDRIGVLAYALTPLSILLASRESLLSVITGVSNHHFMFLHTYLGHVILLQASLHTIGWCVVEFRLYQPQPSVGIAFITQTYIIWGVVAQILLLILWGLSTPLARRYFGYEFFRKSHYVLAMVYIGALIGHWAQLQCFLIPAILLWGIDRALRLIRTAGIHYHLVPGGGKGYFKSLPAKLTNFGEIVRLDIEGCDVRYKVGQHFYLTFPDGKGGIWQSHPFTPLTAPGSKQSYIFRARRGETLRIAGLNVENVNVILTGPYGADTMADYTGQNVLCVAGGTGITFVLPVLLVLARSRGFRKVNKVQLVWVVRYTRDTEWVKDELEELKEAGISVLLYATREMTPTIPNVPTESPTPTIGEAEKSVLTHDTDDNSLAHSHHRPDISSIVREFVETSHTSSRVYLSGPAGMMSDVKEEVGRCNKPGAVWRGDEKGLVELVYDDRLE